ncbi:NepR family anti-sigma factor [Pseudooceanicola sp. 200-1SW]|uniref:NepR family anti-sigma factor n=1 Tax=Pseudooceanicola sp. 200-1SW TaxID=3425949 RepID=UPI003D7F578B
MGSASDENFSDYRKGNMTLGQTKSSAVGGIDDNLRRVFQTTLDEDVPDRFKDLLKQLQEQDSHASAPDQQEHGE